MTFADFSKLEIRVGKIIRVEDLPDPHYATHQLTIDFGAQSVAPRLSRRAPLAGGTAAQAAQRAIKRQRKRVA